MKSTLTKPPKEPQLIKEWFSELQTEGRLSESTLYYYHRNVADFADLCRHTLDPSRRMSPDALLLSINSFRLKLCIGVYLEEGKTKKYIKQKMVAIRLFYKWLLDHRRVPHNPVDMLHLRQKHQWSSLVEGFDLTKEKAIDAWLEHNKRHTERTQGHYEMVIMTFFDFMPSAIGDLEASHIDNYINWLLQRNKNRTANAHLTAIKSFCRWFSEHHNLPNPAEKVRLLREDPPMPRVLTWQEFEKVLAICNETERNLLRFIAHTGLRASEIQKLKWGNIATDGKSFNVVGKGRKLRTLPLNMVCRDVLQNYEQGPSSSTLPFIEPYNKRSALYALCKRLAERADIPVFGPHALRHLFATRLMQKGIPLAKISKLLGHSSVRTTEQLYIHWLPADLEGTTEVLIEGDE